jgi:hypothetical protein
VEPHREKKAPVRSDTMVETGNLLGEDNEPNVIEDEEEEGEEEEALSPHVKLEQVSRDPYADLDGAFGNYGGKADEPQSAVSQVSMEDEIQQAQQQRQQTLPGSEPAKPRKNGTFRQSVAAFNQISQLGL